jgi:hypothetical protein
LHTVTGSGSSAANRRSGILSIGAHPRRIKESMVKTRMLLGAENA